MKLSFPNYSIGRLYVEDTQVGLRFAAEAKDIVSVDSDRGLTLRLNPDISDLSWMERLPPDALISVNCHAAAFDGTQARFIRHLNGLESLQLSHCGVKDADLDFLGVLKKLRTLRLDWTAIGDDGLKNIASLNSLKTLDLSRTRISDSSFSTIASLSDLTHLSLWDCKINGSALAQLAALPKLTHLWLSRTRLDDTTGRDLGQLAQLRSLSVSQTAIGDSVIATLADLPLENLDISQTRVTDLCLETLCTMLNLKSVSACETRLSPDATEKAKRVRPDMQVMYSQKSQKTKIATIHQPTASH